MTISIRLSPPLVQVHAEAVAGRTLHLLLSADAGSTKLQPSGATVAEGAEQIFTKWEEYKNEEGKLELFRVFTVHSCI